MATVILAISVVIPGRREAASPESIATVGGYGFRARPTQVGSSRLGRLAPISGKPEIGGPSRNDGRGLSP